MAKYSTKMIFAVLDVSLIIGLNIGETDKVFFFTFIQLKIHGFIVNHFGHSWAEYDLILAYLGFQTTLQ